MKTEGKRPLRVELLVVPGCASREPLEGRLSELLNELAPEASFLTTVVDTPERAQELRFPGSPTVRINGLDLEPEADRALNFGLG
ncbi:MAG: hypothetical protein C4525_16825 [Desulfarculus sp.]|nr:MAG: hypothetical protein C4525_16825 [Desulfarculus sp.]